MQKKQLSKFWSNTSKSFIFLTVYFVSFLSVNAQTQFWSDDFEDSGSPSSSTRNPSVDYNSGQVSGYFTRTDGTGINKTGAYANGSGSKYWAGEDLDRTSAGQFMQSTRQTITWSNINISGKSNLSFKGLFAAWNGSVPNAVIWDGPSVSSTDYDFLEVEYSIDNGPYISLITFGASNVSAGSGMLLLDTDHDYVGTSTALSDNFSEFSANIAGTGSTLTLRFKAGSSSTVEEFAIDNFRLFEAAPSIINTSGTLSSFLGCSGTASSSQNFTVSGTGLNSNLVITPPSGYEVSTSSGSGYTNSLSLSPSSGTVSSTTVYVRLTNAASGSPSGNIVCSSTGASSKNISVSGTVTLISVSPASQTNNPCYGSTMGSASINPPTGGTSGYSYDWTPGNPSGDGTIAVTGLTAGTWTCTVTDANGCIATQNFTITQPTAISITALSQTNVSCNGGTNGAASINTPTGGAGGFTYNWTPGNPAGDGTVAVTGLSAGNWTCTVTDANSCTAAQSFTIVQPTAISFTALSQTNVSCNGGANGAASVNVPTGGEGGFTYNWTPGNPSGDGSRSVTGLSAGVWTCIVTDANTCTAALNFTITQPNALNLNISSQTNVSCKGGSNGAATVSATGGTSGYTYAWSPNGGSSSSALGLITGSYSVTVTDANSCTATKNITITEPNAIEISTASQTNIICNGDSSGAASVTVTGGTGGYTYNWLPGNPIGDGTASVSGLKAGSWQCNVEDINGCVNNHIIIISEADAIQTNITRTICNGDSVVFGNNVFKTQGLYDLKYKSVNNCDSIVKLTLMVNPIPTVVSTINGSRCGEGTVLLGAQGSIVFRLAANNPPPMPVTLTWFADEFGGTSLGTGVNFTTPSITSTTTYYVEGSRNGCTSKRTAVIATVNHPTLESISKTVCDSYFFNGVNITQSGIYKDTLTNIAGCDSIVTLNLVIKSKPVITQELSDLSVCNKSNANFKVVASGDSLKYVWGKIDGSSYIIVPDEEADSVEFIASSDDNNLNFFTIVYNGCGSDTSNAFLSVTSIDTTVIENNGTLTAQASEAGIRYFWLDENYQFVEGGKTSSNTFTPVQSGKYYLRVSQNGCNDTSAVRQVNVIITNVHTEFISSFVVSPNPSKSSFEITGLNNNVISSVSIEDLNGKTLYSFNSQSVYNHSLSTGIYFVRITSNTGVSVVKLIVE